MQARNGESRNTKCGVSCVDVELKQNRKSSLKKDVRPSLNSTDNVPFEGDCPERCLAHQALLIDRVSRLLFPVGFIAFNIVYWGYYLT